MPIVTIQMMEGREPALKELLLANVTATIAETLVVDPQTIRVLLHELSPSDWGIGGVSKARLDAEKQSG